MKPKTKSPMKQVVELKPPVKPVKPYIQAPPKAPDKYVRFMDKKYVPTISNGYEESVKTEVLIQLIKETGATDLVIDTYGDVFCGLFLQYVEQKEKSEKEYQDEYERYLLRLKQYEKKKIALAKKLVVYNEKLNKYKEELAIYTENSLEQERQKLEKRLKEIKAKKQ